jgi:hypothetical protein
MPNPGQMLNKELPMLNQCEKQRIRELEYLAEGLSLDDAIRCAERDFPVRA